MADFGIDIKAKCNHPNCTIVESVHVEERDWQAYLDGAHVQKIWPELSANDREILISARTGEHLCVKCWDEGFPEEE